MPFFKRDGLNFHFHCHGSGQPLVFLHGLGGDMNQPRRLLENLPGIRLITFDFRGHGATVPLGSEEKLTITQFADDVCALLDRLSLETCVLGGVSLGAAVALRFALLYPNRLTGLILSRPAWLEGTNLFNLRLYRKIAQQIREFGTEKGKQRFLRSTEYHEVLNQSTDTAHSLLGQFDIPRAEETVSRLERLPPDKVIDSLSELAGLQTKTLVLANRRDPIHPYSFGAALAKALPNVQFGELTSKSQDIERHKADIRRLISRFVYHLNMELVTQC